MEDVLSPKEPKIFHSELPKERDHLPSISSQKRPNANFLSPQNRIISINPQNRQNKSGIEIQRTKTELSNQIQILDNKQIIELKNLESQMVLLKQGIQPKFQNIQLQQIFLQKQR